MFSIVPLKSKTLIFCQLKHRLLLSRTVCCLPFLASFPAAHLSFFLTHLDLCICPYTLSPSVTPRPPSPKVKPRVPYLLHRSTDDHVPHWNEDPSKDGQQRPDYSPDDQPAPRATASHGGVRFPPSARTSVCLSVYLPASLPACLAACSPSVSAFAECASVRSAAVFVSWQQRRRQAVPSQDPTEQPRAR